MNRIIQLIMSQNYHVVRASQQDVEFMIQSANRAGWNPGLDDAKSFYATDPNGFFLGKLNDKVIAMGSMVIYDENFAFSGLYMVDRNYQSQGYGLALTEKRLAYVGHRCVGLDGVLNMENRYTRLGYQTDFISSLYQIEGTFPSIPSPDVLAFRNSDFQAICDYDAQCFPARRKVFLNSWLHHPTLVYWKDQQMMGYAVIRPCYIGFKIGPLFADNDEIAEILLSHILSYASGQRVMIAIPEYQSIVHTWQNDYKMQKVFSVARMYRGGKPQRSLNQTYAITSYELG
jgi:hypothetical protein